MAFKGDILGDIVQSIFGTYNKQPNEQPQQPKIVIPNQPPKPAQQKAEQTKPQTNPTSTQNKNTNIQGPSRIDYVNKPKVLGGANTPQSPFDELNLKTYFDSLSKSLTGLSEKIQAEDANIKKTQQEVLAQISSRKGELEKVFEKISEQLKQTNDIPAIKTYKEIAEENNKLMPLMVGVIALGTAIFGNKDGTTMADKMNAMFGALKEKNLNDWKTATEEFKLKLEQWKAKSENIYNKVNIMMQKLMLGEKIDDELAKFKVDFANTNLNTVLALYKETSAMLQKLMELQMNAQYKAATYALNLRRTQVAEGRLNLDYQKNQEKQQKEREKQKIQFEAAQALANYYDAKHRGDVKGMILYGKLYTQLTGKEPPDEKSQSKDSGVGVPKLTVNLQKKVTGG
jgi:hypothetical protein